jgi:hypothetical protein
MVCENTVQCDAGPAESVFSREISGKNAEGNRLARWQDRCTDHK